MDDTWQGLLHHLLAYYEGRQGDSIMVHSSMTSLMETKVVILHIR